MTMVSPLKAKIALALIGTAPLFLAAAASAQLSAPAAASPTQSIDVPRITNDTVVTSPGFGKMLIDISGNGDGGWVLPVQQGAGAPNASTPTLPGFYKDSLTGVLYCYTGTGWSAISSTQTGATSPTAATPTDPALYKDTSTGTLYCYDPIAGAWAPLASSFDITDGTNSQTVDGSNAVTFAAGDPLAVTVSVPDTVTYSFNYTGANPGDILVYNGVSATWQPGTVHPPATIDPASNPALSAIVGTQVITLDLDTAGSYDNAASGLTANSVQAAIDELAATAVDRAKVVVAVPAASPSVTVAPPAGFAAGDACAVLVRRLAGAEELGHTNADISGASVVVELLGQATAAGTHEVVVSFEK